jgi:hypothetical protein
VHLRKAGTKGKGSTTNLTVDNASPADVVRYINEGMQKQAGQSAQSSTG